MCRNLLKPCGLGKQIIEKGGSGDTTSQKRSLFEIVINVLSLRYDTIRNHL